MRSIVLLLRTSWMSLVISLLASVGSGLCLTLMISQVHAATLSASQAETLAIVPRILALLVLFLLTVLLATTTNSRVSRKALYLLRSSIISKILRTSYLVTEHLNEKLIPVLVEDVRLTSYVVSRIPAVLTALATVVGSFGYIIYMSPLMAAGMLVVFGVSYFFIWIFSTRSSRFSRKLRVVYDNLFVRFYDLKEGLKELKMNPGYRDSVYEKGYLAEEDQLQDLRRGEVFWTTMSFRSLELVFFAALAGLFSIVGIYGKPELSIVGGVITVILFSLSPLSTFVSFLGEYRNMEVAVERIQALEDALSPETVPANPPAIEPLKSISMENVVFEHSSPEQPERVFTLGPVNIEIPANSITYLVGHNGSGKSTLGKVLCGLYTPASGDIKWNGTPVRQLIGDGYRARFSCMFTDFHIFKNLGFSGGSQLERFNQLISDYKLTEVIKHKNGVLQNLDFSQGQKERLALIVALTREAEVYILDEVTANQDEEFRRRFHHETVPSLKKAGKTVIVITHDRNYLDRAETLVEMQTGKILTVTQQHAPAHSGS